MRIIRVTELKHDLALGRARTAGVALTACWLWASAVVAQNEPECQSRSFACSTKTEQQALFCNARRGINTSPNVTDCSHPIYQRVARGDVVLTDNLTLDVRCLEEMTLEDEGRTYTGPAVTMPVRLYGAPGSDVVLDCNGAFLMGGEAMEIATPVDPNAHVQGTTPGGRPLAIRAARDQDGAFLSRVENVTVKNCRILGGVLVDGRNSLQDLPHLQASSYEGGHTGSVRRDGPRNVALDNVEITALSHDGRAPLYVGTGAIATRLTHSVIQGNNWGVKKSGELEPGEDEYKSRNPAIYLEAESKGAVIQNNCFLTDQRAPDNSNARPREVIAVDGSSANRILGNYFAGLDTGGIYLYRNCGELGIARHNSPTKNHILNNFFYYNHYGADPEDTVRPAVFIGSRDKRRDEPKAGCWCEGGTITREGSDQVCDGGTVVTPGPDEDGRCGCDDAAAAIHLGRELIASDNMGPGRNWDYARYNVVMQNQFLNRDPARFISVYNGDRNAFVNTPNYVGCTLGDSGCGWSRPGHNAMVSARIERGSGCFVEGSYLEILPHGAETLAVDHAGQCTRVSCDDGQVQEIGSCPPLLTVEANCHSAPDQEACLASLSCPEGSGGLVAVTAGCNLERQAMTSAQLASIKEGTVRITRPSDNPSEGVCLAGHAVLAPGFSPDHLLGELPGPGALERRRDIATRLAERDHLAKGTAGTAGVWVGCAEHDANGGECHAWARAYCLPAP